MNLGVSKITSLFYTDRDQLKLILGEECYDNKLKEFRQAVQVVMKKSELSPIVAALKLISIAQQKIKEEPVDTSIQIMYIRAAALDILEGKTK
jgi:hypothetical protein